MKLATPTLNHASATDWEEVYEPAEDSFLLIDALETDIDLILERKPSFCLEIGSGSGVVLSALATALHNVAFFVGTDINTSACKLTQRTARNNRTDVDSICADLAPFRSSTIDLVVFNPPYVPTPSKEVSGLGIERSWAGGLRGREIVDRFVEKIVPLLSSQGLGYLLLLDRNDPDEVKGMLEKAGCSVRQVADRKFRGESLVVLRFDKTLYCS